MESLFCFILYINILTIFFYFLFNFLLSHFVFLTGRPPAVPHPCFDRPRFQGGVPGGGLGGPGGGGSGGVPGGVPGGGSRGGVPGGIRGGPGGGRKWGSRHIRTVKITPKNPSLSYAPRAISRNFAHFRTSRKHRKTRFSGPPRKSPKNTISGPPRKSVFSAPP